MSLIDLAETEGEAFSAYTVDQIVAICGDGKLKDNSDCSSQFRQFISLQSSDKLAEYAKYCLATSFDKSGFVLQDIINEIGRRLKYEVKDGRYSGTRSHIGFDGLWFDGDSYIIVEVKTTDAYRINLDNIVSYGEKSAEQLGAEESKISALIVVGRQDTGDLEAQVRGSKHAWSVRLISIDALIKMLFVSEQLEGDELNKQIKKVILPFEYTKVDEIVDLVFETQQETDFKTQVVDDLSDDADGTATRVLELTSKALLESKRKEIVGVFFKSRGLKVVKRSKTNFADPTDALHVTCALSKRYKRDYQPYWYALHQPWIDFMGGGEQGYFILGCMDLDEAYAIPLELINEYRDCLNATDRDGKIYWHIALNLDGGTLSWNLSKIGKKIDLKAFAFSLT